MDEVSQGLVPFTKDNLMKCVCGNCPIHKQSDCIKQLVAGLGEHPEVMDKNPLQRDEIPGLYCGGGRGVCEDLNFKNACVCGTCDNFNEGFHLADNTPGGYYCKGGRAV